MKINTIILIILSCQINILQGMQTSTVATHSSLSSKKRALEGDEKENANKKYKLEFPSLKHICLNRIVNFIIKDDKKNFSEKMDFLERFKIPLDLKKEILCLIFPGLILKQEFFYKIVIDLELEKELQEKYLHVASYENSANSDLHDTNFEIRSEYISLADNFYLLYGSQNKNNTGSDRIGLFHKIQNNFFVKDQKNQEKISNENNIEFQYQTLYVNSIYKKFKIWKISCGSDSFFVLLDLSDEKNRKTLKIISYKEIVETIKNKILSTDDIEAFWKNILRSLNNKNIDCSDINKAQEITIFK